MPLNVQRFWRPQNVVHEKYGFCGRRMVTFVCFNGGYRKSEVVTSRDLLLSEHQTNDTNCIVWRYSWLAMNAEKWPTRQTMTSRIPLVYDLAINADIKWPTRQRFPGKCSTNMTSRNPFLYDCDKCWKAKAPRNIFAQHDVQKSTRLRPRDKR